MRRSSQEKDIENGQSSEATSSTANSALAARSKRDDDDGRYCCLVFVAVVMQISILLLSLVEALFTTLHFDEDEVKFLYVALVFGIFALFDSTVKTFVSCTKTLWDDLAVELLSETLQVALYMYFCNFSESSTVWLPIVGGAQIATTIGLFCMKWHESQSPLDNDQDNPTNATTESKEDPDVQMMSIIRGIMDKLSFVGNFYLPLFLAVMATVIPLLCLLTQEQSPFRTQHFEIVLAIYLWIVEVGMKLCFQTLTNQFEHFIREWNRFGSGSDDEEARLNPVDVAATGLTAVVSGVLAFAAISFYVYLTVLSWQWWLSPEIENMYDKVITMLLILSLPLGCCMSCFKNCCRHPGDDDFTPELIG